MVTFEALRDAKFDAIRGHAATWTRTMHQLDDIARDFELGVCGMTERGGWRGDAAGLADSMLETTLRRIRIAALETRSIAAELDFAVETLAATQTRLFSEMHAALGEGFVVTVAGERFTVAEAMGPTGPRDAQQVAAIQGKIDGYAQRFQAILAEAAQADALHAAALAKLSAAEVAAGDAAALKNATEDLRGIFTGMPPEQASTWWAALSEAQRQAYLLDFPHEIGSMDGLPAAVRDSANRVALSLRLAELGPLVAEGTATVAEQREWKNLKRIDQQLATNHERPPESQLLLLKFGNQYLDGQVVMAIGDPDTAKNTVIQVPGVNATVSGKLEEQVSRLTRLQRATIKASPTGESAAAIVWLDYDAPEAGFGRFGSSISPDRAKQGAEKFDRFVDGMRAAGPPNQHLTASGHSYGTSVVAYAARDEDGLNADEIMFVGSPGVHVDNVDDLNFDPTRVWVGMSGDDMIAPPGFVFHDRLPNDPDFGATRFPANTGGHFSYWDMKDEKLEIPDTSLGNQAKVAAGVYDPRQSAPPSATSGR
ncbi:alpha/beta hydrolase [Yinghuangia soli]|uniref:Alpha/beta hydrolase family protein n=1 Tax=Yinghuangia soli TaxID=2908204 RepID=A0AA41PZY0_9ACTN|nr:alpha/beta hydrolase [Yinghuangia soli]MCF2528682.1 alpha/beta hydrolase family protein [Yinghuangia soli]